MRECTVERRCERDIIIPERLPRGVGRAPLAELGN
jgi:hypothetical protein